MANFAGDLSQYAITASLVATATGVTTNSHVDGASVDTIDLGSNIFTGVLVVGNVSGTSPVLSVKLQQSATGTNNWTDITGASFATVTTTNTIRTVSFKPTQRYVRTTTSAAVSGTTPVFEATCLIVGPNRHMPTNQTSFSTAAAAAN